LVGSFEAEEEKSSGIVDALAIALKK